MTNKISLHTPTYDELWYRQKLLSDTETMSYNKGYDLGFDGYDNETGCIDFPQCQWKSWYNYFIGNEPERYYAYIVCKDDNAFIGEVNLHKNNAADWYDMGIVLEAKYRGKGYAVEALKLLLNYAFHLLGAKAVHNDFEEARAAAIKTHLSARFSEYSRHDGIIELVITREQYNHEKLNDHIKENLSGDDCKTALEFISFLQAMNLQFVKDESDCWKDKIYYWVKRNDKCVCFIAVKDPDEKENRWTVWSDDIETSLLEKSSISDDLQQIAWEHIDHCGNCGSCGGGRHKVVFGKKFDNVCGCTFRFDNPTKSDLGFMKKMIVIQCERMMSFDEFIKFRNVQIRDDIHKKIINLFYTYLSSVSGDSNRLPDKIGDILNMNLSSAKAVTGCFNVSSIDDCPYENTDFYILFDNGIKIYIYGSIPNKPLVHLNSNQYVVFIVSNTVNGTVSRKENNHVYIQ